MGFLPLLVIGLLVLGIALIIRRLLYQRNFPSGEKKDLIVRTLLETQGRGAGYKERFSYLREQRLREDVANDLIIEARRLFRQVPSEGEGSYTEPL